MCKNGQGCARDYDKARCKIKKANLYELKAQIIELVKKQMEESEAGEGDSAAR
jgi:hypothetical protein